MIVGENDEIGVQVAPEQAVRLSPRRAPEFSSPLLDIDTVEGVITDPISLHKYLYADANPVMGSDPSGHDDLLDNLDLSDESSDGNLADDAFALADEAEAENVSGYEAANDYAEGNFGLIGAYTQASFAAGQFAADNLGLDTQAVFAVAGAVGGSLAELLGPYLSDAADALLVNSVGCFCAGTLLLCSKGLRPIECIALGTRVLTSPSDAPGPTIDPSKYMVIRLSFVSDGQEFQMSFLRPAGLVSGLGVGDTMDISVLELKLRGRARLLAIEPCPPLDDGPGHLVTGTFSGQSIDVLLVKLQGLEGTLEMTGNHPVFSEDGRDFVPANSLHHGERLRTREGSTVIEAIGRKRGEWRTFNLEIGGANQYYVTDQSVLVHNANGVLNGDGAFAQGSSLDRGIAEAESTIAQAKDLIAQIRAQQGIENETLAEILNNLLSRQIGSLASAEGKLVALLVALSN